MTSDPSVLPAARRTELVYRQIESLVLFVATRVEARLEPLSTTNETRRPYNVPDANSK